MKGFGDKFNKYEKIVARIDRLTEQVVKNPKNEKLKTDLKKAEEGLYKLIQKEEKEIERMLESLNDIYEEWEE